MSHDHKTMTFTDLYHFTNNTCDFGGGRITVSSVSYNQALCSEFGSSTNHPPTMQSPGRQVTQLLEASFCGLHGFVVVLTSHGLELCISTL